MAAAVQAKNAALKEAGAIVPDSFEALEGAVKQTYDKLVADGVLVPQPDVPAPSVPLDLEAAKKAGKARPAPETSTWMAGWCISAKSAAHLHVWRTKHDHGESSLPSSRSTPLYMRVCILVQVRVPTNIVSSICDDRGEEPTYNGVDMSTLIEGDYGVGDVISLLWFKRALPKYATRFIDMCVMLCADHGPCVSGEHLFRLA
jgi:ATP citrate (pro-S)-lyase